MNFTKKRWEKKHWELSWIDEFLKIYPIKRRLIPSVSGYDLSGTDNPVYQKERVKCPDSKIYSFQFTYEFPMFDGKIAWHCSEIPFVFQKISIRFRCAIVV